MANNEFKAGLAVSSSPHLVTKLDTRKTMCYVVAALVPSIIMATVFWGISALVRVVLGAIFAYAFEDIYNKVMHKKEDTTRDCSAIVTGVILALNLPANFPVWMEFIGCGVAIVIVKCLYGGIGKNIANPAIVGRIVLLLSFTSYMTSWPLTNFQKAAADVDAVTGATPLGVLSEGGELPSLLDMLVGNIGGAMGETCTIAILIGGIFLIWKKIISPIIPCTFIATVFVFSLIYYGVTGGAGQYNAFQMAVYQILAGGVFFGAFFCATDYVTSPIMDRGKVIYGIGCGLFTMIIRLFASYPEGVSFAILFMNIVTPLIDRLVIRDYYGIAKAEKAARLEAKALAKAAGGASEEAAAKEKGGAKA